MYRLIIVFFIGVLTGSCQNPTQQRAVNNADTTKVVDSAHTHLTIVDSLMLDYRHKYNTLRGTPGADTSVAWIFSNIEETDTATYLVYQVIHDVTKPTDSFTEYSTDEWVYIDTVKRRLYEYDVATENLK